MQKVTLKVLRIMSNMTQEQVAKELNIATSTWSKWENGKSFPDVPEIGKIEKLFNISYADIKFLPHDTV